MNTEIPTGAQLSGSCLYTQDIGLAAICMADDLIPRLTLSDINVFVEGEDRRTQFTFPDNPDVIRVFGEWNKCVQGASGNTWVSKVYRAFHYWNQFVNLIKDAKLNPRPLSVPAGFEWTTNTKLPATALALMPGPVLTPTRLHRMVYRNGRDCGYIIKTGEVTKAYEDPDTYILLNPDDHLSYVVASFYHRDHLRDIVKQVPARHIFRNGADIHVISEPQPETKEIPCLTK